MLVVSNFSVLFHHRSLSAFREDSWFKSLFVRKVDPRKDAHSHLLAKKEDNNLYKIQCMYCLWLAVIVMAVHCKRWTWLHDLHCLKIVLKVFFPRIILWNLLNGVLSTHVLWFPCSSQCQAWVSWCLQWTLVRSPCSLIHFFRCLVKALLLCSADLLLFNTTLCVCVCDLVRTSCLPFMLTLNTLVSLWAPGTRGTGSRIKQVRAHIKLHVRTLLHTSDKPAS